MKLFKALIVKLANRRSRKSIDALKKQYQKELLTIRRSHARQVDLIKATSKAEYTSLQQSHEQSLTEMQREYDSIVDSLKNHTYKSNVNLHRSTEMFKDGIRDIAFLEREFNRTMSAITDEFLYMTTKVRDTMHEVMKSNTRVEQFAANFSKTLAEKKKKLKQVQSHQTTATSSPAIPTTTLPKVQQ